jgi:PAS domain S-box-containing protein
MTNLQNSQRTSVQSHKLHDERFETMIAEVEDYAMILLDANGTICSWNKGAERIKGYQASEIVGKSFRLFYTKEDKDNGLPDRLLQVALKEGKANHEGWRIKKDGSRFWGSITLTALHDTQGKTTGILEVTRDLTEKKEAEDRQSNYAEELRLKNEALQRSEDRYHKMVSDVADYAIILLDKDGRVIEWNKGAETLKGYKAEEILGKSIRLFYPVEDKATNLPDQLLAEAVAKGSVNREGWRIRKDGSRFWAGVTITALFDGDRQIIGFSKVTKDLTPRKIAEEKLSNFMEELKQRNEELRQSEERYHKMITEVQDYAIILLNNEGIIQNWNMGATLVKGYEAEEIVGKSFKTFYTQEDINNKIPDSLLQHAERTGKAVSEGWRVRKDGRKFWGSVVITALHADDGHIIGFSKVTRDLTERKSAEDKMWATTLELQAKNKVLENLNEELASFAYAVSHDLKEPVRKIQILAARQREPGKSPEQIEEYSRKIEKAAAGMQKLMTDLLEYSELSSETKKEPVDLNEVFESAKSDHELKILEKSASVVAERLPVINGIRHQLHQVFSNLLSNALKFGKENEPLSIKIKTRVVNAGEVLAKLDKEKAKAFYEIIFSDNGIGFDPMYSKKIFEVFQQLQSRKESTGSGIGLSIVKKVMQNHNGDVVAESQPNVGTTFRLYFPEKSH